MAILAFFLLGVLSLNLFSPVQVAVTWHDPNIFHFIITLFTHMFSHAGWGHLMGNFIFVLPYALYLEHRVGVKRFCEIWLLCGFAAIGLDWVSMWIGNAHLGVIGSSGAAFGIAAATLTMVDEAFWLKVAARITLSYFLLTQAYLAYLTVTGEPMMVAFAAHLGGILGGIVLALVEKRRARLSTSK